MHRFFVSPDCIGDSDVTLSGHVARQLARVLRSRAGDRIVVLDDTGWEYFVTLTAVDPEQVRGVVTGRAASGGEPRIEVTLYQALLKADRFELVLQKGTELGVSAFVPVVCARSVPRERDGARSANRRSRWRRIVTEAAEQARRGRVPTLESTTELLQAFDEVEGLAVIPWEEEDGCGLRAALTEWKAGGRDISSVSVFIGPEGGFTSEEVDHARSRGIVPVSLGRRILRAETAGIVAVSAVLYELGELGG